MPILSWLSVRATRLIRPAGVALLLLLAWPALAEDVRIASWNIQHLGWQNDKDYNALGRIGGAFDVIAVQEVMNLEGLDGFVAALERETGETWERIYSHRIGRGRYKEKYAFVYRPSRVHYLDGAVVYLDQHDNFARQPFAARFQTADGAHRFVLATVHILYGNRISDRTPEIKYLARYWDWLHEVFDQDSNFILLGDFNLRPSHNAWAPFHGRARSLINDGATTISTIEGRFANLYDLIWIDRDSTLPIRSTGILAFPEVLGLSHERSRDIVSDHVPVYAVVETPGPFPPRQSGGVEPTWQDGRSAPSSPNTEARPRAPPDGTEPDGPGIRGNRNSQIYHLPECPSYDRVGKQNRVTFASEEEAVRNGYRRAGNCP